MGAALDPLTADQHRQQQEQPAPLGIHRRQRPTPSRPPWPCGRKGSSVPRWWPAASDRRSPIRRGGNRRPADASAPPASSRRWPPGPRAPRRPAPTTAPADAADRVGRSPAGPPPPSSHARRRRRCPAGRAGTGESCPPRTIAPGRSPSAMPPRPPAETPGTKAAIAVRSNPPRGAAGQSHFRGPASLHAQAWATVKRPTTMPAAKKPAATAAAISVSNPAGGSVVRRPSMQAQRGRRRPRSRRRSRWPEREAG